MKENKKYIGVFDSGLGGLTVLKELKKSMPNESFIYFGDTAHLPYGNKSKASVIQYSLNIANFLFAQQVKAIVVACNTASSVALETLNKKYSIPVLNVIDSSVLQAVSYSKSKTIGVIGTETTILSRTYQKKINKINAEIEVVTQACPLFVPIIEEGLINKQFSNYIAEYYLQRFKNTSIDTLILGCTHYPLFKSIIEKHIHSKVLIVDSAKATSEYVLKYLNNKKLLCKNKMILEDKYYVSDKPTAFNHLAKSILNIEPNAVQQIHL